MRFRPDSRILWDMKRFLTVLLLIVSLIATPLLIDRADAHDMGKMSAHCAQSSDSDHNAKDPMHQAHHCCVHASAIGTHAAASIHVSMSVSNQLSFAVQNFSSAFQPGPLLEPPSHA